MKEKEQVNSAAAELARLSWKNRSDARRQASRENGKKGGRPRTVKPA